jgi:hypothetical protein
LKVIPGYQRRPILQEENSIGELPDNENCAASAERPVMKMIINNLPRDLHDQFKAWCARRGYSMTGKIRQMMQDCVNEKFD